MPIEGISGVTVQSPLLKSPLPLRERARERGQMGWGTERLQGGDDRYEPREPGAAYNALFTPENGLLRVENGFY